MSEFFCDNTRLFADILYKLHIYIIHIQDLLNNTLTITLDKP